jgi:phosphonopyruvate decarboxylase
VAGRRHDALRWSSCAVGAGDYSRGVLRPHFLFDQLNQAGVSLYAGVPDSLLKDFCAYVTDHAELSRHVITANEGAAVGLAMGHHLATGGPALVYMQNSGLGNTVNPLTSLTDPAVYGVPMVLLVGWRGEPGVKDEPQHVHMGKVTRQTLEAIEVPYELLPDDEQAAAEVVQRMAKLAVSEQTPVALVATKGLFGKYQLKAEADEPYPMTREQAVKAFAAHMPEGAVVVSTTGKPSRELFEVREARDEAHASDLLIVGGMGHASQIALGVALEKRERPVYCIDGDGAVLMHMGSLAIIAATEAKNFKHLVLNNAAHDSVGGQPTVGFQVDLCAVARACGYPSAECVDSEEQLGAALDRLAAAEGPAMLEVRVRRGARADLGRPTMTPRELKQQFMAYVAK